MSDYVKPSSPAFDAAFPLRYAGKDETVHDFVVREGWMWVVMLKTGEVVAFDPDDVDPGRYGVKDAGVLRNLVSGGPENVAAFALEHAWFAREVGRSTWTAPQPDRLAALRAVYHRQEAERAARPDIDLMQFLGD